jgi:hypothetical protein
LMVYRYDDPTVHEGDSHKLEHSSGLFTFTSITDVHPIDGCRKMTFSKSADKSGQFKEYGDHGLEIHSDHDPHDAKKIKDKTFILVCRSEQHREEWLSCFAEMVGMAPGERKRFQWSAAMVE